MKIIKNFEELTKDSNQIRKDLLKILEYALEKSLPESAIKASVRLKGNELKITNEKLFLSEINNIFVIGSGKATYRMAKSLYDILGGKITRGIITTNKVSKEDIGPIKVIQAGHPLPTEKGIKGANEILSLAKEAKEKDLIIALISGGGSVLLAAPADGISLPDMQKTNELLLASGASIKEINTVRKHISKIKGGKLSGAAYPASLISLIISDVVGDDLSTIASGPTVGDSTTFKDAYNILEQYQLIEKAPISVLHTIKEGIEGKIPETPSPDDEVLSETLNKIILSNDKALENAQKKAIELGYNTSILSSKIEGPSRDAGIFHGEIAKEISLSGIPIKPPAIVLSGGECVVTLDKIGEKEGGPNQECVLGFAEKMSYLKEAAFLSVDTDGIDGYSKFAGGIIGGNKIRINREEIEEALKNHSSSNFFRKTGGGIITGETGTNVNDLRILGISK
ncbi:glycerate kinase [candidate division WOR-3 bacterium]|nr:glycerate kinase [candidate division WOR-3 bacterium]